MRKIKRSELLPAGIVFIGGGSNTSNIEELSKSILKLPATIGTTEIFGNVKTKLRDSAWFVTLGLILGSQDIDGYSEGSFRNFWKEIKSAIKSSVKQLMP